MSLKLPCENFLYHLKGGLRPPGPLRAAPMGPSSGPTSNIPSRHQSRIIQPKCELVGVSIVRHAVTQIIRWIEVTRVDIDQLP